LARLFLFLRSLLRLLLSQAADEPVNAPQILAPKAEEMSVEPERS
jgi:hypothetical protein